MLCMNRYNVCKRKEVEHIGGADYPRGRLSIKKRVCKRGLKVANVES